MKHKITNLDVRANTCLNQAKALYKHEPKKKQTDQNRGVEEFASNLRSHLMKGWTREYEFALNLPIWISDALTRPGQWVDPSKGPRRWRFDFANVREMVAVEVEGGIWTEGRHTRGRGYTEDCCKYNLAAATGWKVFRFPTEMVLKGDAILFVRDYLSINPE